MNSKRASLCLIIVIATGVSIWAWTASKQLNRLPRFEAVGEQAGIEFFHFNGSDRDSLLPEDVGSGAGWADYDNDGDEDLYLVNYAGGFLLDETELAKRTGNRLYRNNGDGTFTDVSDQLGVGDVGHNYACLWFDYDNDGWLDLAITHSEGVKLFRNQQGTTFVDTSQTSGLGNIQRFLLGMTAGDYDRDGDLDLYLCGYVNFDKAKARNRPLVAGRPAVWTNPVSYPAEPNILMRNESDGTFTDVTETAGVANKKGKSMQALFCDFDNDGWPDLFVGNDVATADAFFHNEGDGTFVNATLEAGLFDPRASMGIAVGDIWHRGWVDMLTTHWVAEDHALWKNRTGDFQEHTATSFDDVGPATGIVAAKESAYVGWGIGLYDFDNDGNLDIMLANGSTIEDELTLDVLKNPKLMPQPAQLLWNDGNGVFSDLGGRAGAYFDEHKVGRGLAFCDYDQDGDVDAVIVNHGDGVELLRNVTTHPGHWIQIRLNGTTSNRFGIGARVLVQAGELLQSCQRVLGSSYLSSDTSLCHFGLGNYSVIDSIEVHWPSGKASRVTNVKADQIVTINEDL